MYIILLACLSIFIIFIFIVAYVYIRNRTSKSIIYCLMITGKDDDRIALAKLAIENFREQTYPNKRLIIINHHSHLSLLKHDNDNDVIEFIVDKANFTLGGLRNISLTMVPAKALWTCWDDDDYRDPQYLTLLASKMRRTHADCVVFTNRLEHNLANGFTWKTVLKKGFIHVLARMDPRIHYLDKDSMEDLHLIALLEKDIGFKVVRYDNEPAMYIRLVHGTNTSLYVNNAKKHVILRKSNSNTFYEEDATHDQVAFVRKIMCRHFRKC